jgi:crotonobetainyl-CoA hydratase
MSEPQYVETRRHGRTLTITLRKPKVNAIDYVLSRQVHAALRELQDDPDLIVGVLTAEGDRIFSAGMDLKAFAAQELNPERDADPVNGWGPGGFAGITEAFDIDKPVIAAINGAAIGGGFEMALACDLILMSETAWFQLPEMQRGFLPEAGAIQRLPRILPPTVATDLFLTGRRFEAAEARQWGLARDVVPAAELQSAAAALAEEVAKGAPLAIRALKAVLRKIETLPIQQAMATTKPNQSGLPIYETMIRSHDALEGSKAFAEKRAPNWLGR